MPKRKQSDEIEVFSDRFSNLEERAAWLFEFLGLDLNTLSKARASETREAAREFATLGFAAVEPGVDLAADDKPTDAAMQAVQAEVHDGIDRVWKNRWWVMQEKFRYGIARIDRTLTGGPQIGSFRSLFVHAAMDIVKTEWQRLRRCPNCTRLFLKVGKQAYCSKRCSQRARWERFKPQRAARDYHAERVSAARKRLGPNVRIRRKKSKRGLG